MIIQEGKYVVVKGKDFIYCIKIQRQKFAKILSFKILLDKFIGLEYDSNYTYYDDTFHPCSQIYDLKSYGDICLDIAKDNLSFEQRTEFSKNKYIERKKLKICLEVTLFKPTPALVWEAMNARCANKMCYISLQDLATIMCYSNIHADDSMVSLVFETCQGLIVASMLEKITSHGTIIQLYHGDFPNRTCIEYFDFPEKYLESMCSLNVKQVIKLLKAKNDDTLLNTKSKSNILSPPNSEKHGLQSPNEIKESNDINAEKTIPNGNVKQLARRTLKHDLQINDKSLKMTSAEKLLRSQENQKAETLMFVNTLNKNPDCDQIDADINAPSISKRAIRCADSLVIATKFSPQDTVLSLIPFLKFSRPVVIYSQFREPLIDCYLAMKETKSFINMNISETSLTHYQVLPERTHPQINMEGHWGFILTALHVDPGNEICLNGKEYGII